MQYLIANMIQKPEVGSVHASLPLHMSVVHWFEHEGAVADIGNILLPILTTPVFLAEVVHCAMFGPNKDVPVNRVVRSKELFALHTSIVSALDDLGARHTHPEWTGQGWNPHVTHQGKDRLYDGDSFIVDSLDLIQSTNWQTQPRGILARIALSTSSSTNFPGY